MRSRQLRQTSVCQFSTCSWTHLEDLARFQAFGIQSIGIWRRKLEDFGVEAAIDLLFESRLNVTSLHWAGGFTGDGRRFDDAIVDTQNAIRQAAAINAQCLLVHPGSLNRHIHKHANRLVQSAFESIVPYANDHGVQLVIEPVLDQGDSPWTFHRQLDDSLRLLDRFPELGLNLDLYHVGFCADTFERLPEYVERVKLVQLADRTFKSLDDGKQKVHRRSSFRLPLGEGNLDLSSWLSALGRLGYDGPLEVEVHGSEMRGRNHFGLIDQTYDYLDAQAKRFTIPRPKSNLRGSSTSSIKG